jgi:hypothetical protein
MSKIRKPKIKKLIAAKETDTFGDTISVFPVGDKAEDTLKGVIFECNYRTVTGKKRIVLYKLKQIRRIAAKLIQIADWMESKP